MAVRKIQGSWYVDFRWRFHRYRKKSPRRTKNAAKEYEDYLKRRLIDGKSIDGAGEAAKAGKTFAQFAEGWLTRYVDVNNKPSEARAKRIIARTDLLPAFGSMSLADIETSDVDCFKQKQQARGLSNKTINNHLTILRRCLRSAVEWSELDRLPAIIALKTPPPETDFLTDDEVAALLDDRQEPAWNLMVLLAVRTGMRLGELLALEWRAVDLDRGVITVSRSIVRGIVASTKSNRVRFVPVPPDLAGSLARGPRLGNLVLERNGGGFRSDGMATRALERICRRVGVRRIGWHKLRHTYASQLATRGLSAHTIKKLLGHSTLLMTERYMHLAPTALDDARLLLDDIARGAPRRLNGWAPGGQRQLQALAEARPTLEIPGLRSQESGGSR